MDSIVNKGVILMKFVNKSIKTVIMNMVKSDATEADKQEAISNYLGNGIKDYNQTQGKELVSIGLKTTLALAGIVMNKDLFIKYLSTTVEYMNNKPQDYKAPKHVKVRNTLKLLSTLPDAFCAKTLSDIDDEHTRKMFENVLELCSDITGLSIEDIVKLQYEYTAKDKPISIYNYGDDIVLTSKVNDPEDRIPSLIARVLLAYSLWANGDAPNEFGFHVGSIKSIKEYFSDLRITMLETENKYDKPKPIERTPLINEDGSINYK